MTLDPTPRDALIKARDRFREYEASHSLKLQGALNPIDHRSISEKAARNKAMADMLDEVLARMGGDGGVEAMRDALEKIVAGEIPRPLGQRWRADGQPSKFDVCIHRVSMADDCGNCVSDFALSAIRARSEG